MQKKTFYLSSIYRPPSNNNNNNEIFFEKFDEFLELLNRNNCTYLVFGDFNINLLKITQCPLAQKYLSIIHRNGFTNGIFKATRVQATAFSLIDHILIKNEMSVTSFRTIISDISDHFFTSVSLKYNKPTRTQKTIRCRKFNVQTMTQFRNALNNLNWNHVLASNDTNAAFNQFFDTFLELFEIYFPLYSKKISTKSTAINDFMTSGLLTSKNQKNVLHKLYLKNRTEENFVVFKKYGNIYNALIRTSKRLTIERNLVLNKKK